MKILSADKWDTLADAVLTHDPARERAAWLALTCLCHELAIPGGRECASCLIVSAHRRDDVERAAILALPAPPYQRWFGDTAFSSGGAA